jgi:hypothetical protein
MTQSFSKEYLMNKWAPIIESIGVTGSKANWMAEYAQLHQDKQSIRDEKIDSVLDESETTTNFPILPMAMKVASQTVGLDLVSVQPIGGNSQEEIDRIQAEIKAENREGKIESVLENKEYKEKTIKDHPDYKNGMPSSQLFYMDFKYGHKKTRRSGKKHKKK